MVEKQLYVDPVLYSRVNLKRIETGDFDTFQDIVAFVWTVYLKENFPIRGYRTERGEIIYTTQMQRTSVRFPEELYKRIQNKLNEFGKIVYGKINFSHITNELLKRIYLDNEY